MYNLCEVRVTIWKTKNKLISKITFLFAYKIKKTNYIYRFIFVNNLYIMVNFD